MVTPPTRSKIPRWTPLARRHVAQSKRHAALDDWGPIKRIALSRRISQFTMIADVVARRSWESFALRSIRPLMSLLIFCLCDNSSHYCNGTFPHPTRIHRRYRRTCVHRHLCHRAPRWKLHQIVIVPVRGWDPLGSMLRRNGSSHTLRCLLQTKSTH